MRPRRYAFRDTGASQLCTQALAAGRLTIARAISGNPSGVAATTSTKIPQGVALLAGNEEKRKEQTEDVCSSYVRLFDSFESAPCKVLHQEGK